MAGWLGLERVVAADRGDLAPALQRRYPTTAEPRWIATDLYGSVAGSPLGARGVALLAFDAGDLVEAALVAATLELGREEHVDDGEGERLAQEAAAERRTLASLCCRASRAVVSS